MVKLTPEQARRALEMRDRRRALEQIARALGVPEKEVAAAVNRQRRKREKLCRNCPWRKDGLEICCLPRCYRQNQA